MQDSRIASTITTSPAPPHLPRAEAGFGARAARLRRAALAITLGAAALRLLLAAVTPLVPDETYYWEWSRRLAAGYFDHPPAIAVLVRGGTELFGATALGVRLLSVLAGLAAMLSVLDLARRHGGAEAGLRAAVIAVCVPLAATGLVLATPDAPLLLAFALGIGALDRALAATPGSRASWVWWGAAGGAVGLGLLSKYTAVLLPFGVLVAVLLRPSLRRWLRAPEPYVASAGALALFAPVVAWNATHDWASFAFQLEHGLGRSSGSPLSRVLEMLGGQLGLVSPILFVMMAAAVVTSLRRDTDDRRFALAVVATVTFGFFVYSALHQRVEANWPAAAYIPGFVLLAVVAGERAWRRWLRIGCGLGAAMVALIYLHTLHPVLPIPPPKDPIARAHGWDAVAAAAHGVAGAAATGGGAVHYAANRYQDASQLAFHLPRNPGVYSLNLESRPNQYEYWTEFRSAARRGETLVLVLGEAPDPHPVIRSLRPHFEAVQSGEKVVLRRGAGGAIGERRIWILEGWRGSWPAHQ